MAIAIHSALSYALELLDMPNLTLKNSGSPSKRYTKETLCLCGYRQDLARAFATKLRDRVKKKCNVVPHSAIASHDHLFYVYA